MTNFNDMTITDCDNGFMVSHGFGNRVVFTSFTAAAEHFGEPPRPSLGSHHTTYQPDTGAYTLREARLHYRDGRKIQAIKLLRNAFTPRLGLREAIELLESLCGE